MSRKPVYVAVFVLPRPLISKSTKSLRRITPSFSYGGVWHPRKVRISYLLGMGKSINLKFHSER